MKKYSNIKDLELLSQSALESSLAGFWDWDMVTNEEYLSPRFKEMFGYEDHEMENTPESWQRIAVKEDLPQMFAAFQRHIDSKGKVPFNSVVRYYHKNGNIIWVRCNGKIVKWSKEGIPLRAIGCHIDITEEKELEIKLMDTIAERDVLLQEIHHRVKNNLQLILSLARLKGRKSSINISDLKNSIQSIASAYEAIYRSDRLDTIMIGDYLNRIVSPLLNNKQIKHVVECPILEREIDFLIPIGLIITELINNSLKYAFEEQKDKLIKIEVSIHKGNLKLLYSDNGKGFNNAFFENTNQGKSYGKYIIKALSKQINGEVNFYNNNGAITEILIGRTSEN